MEPIARYREKRFEGRRDFQLFHDRVVIVAKEYMGAESESSIMLNTLVAVPNRARVRGSEFSWAVMMVVLSVALLQSGTVDLFSYWGGMAASMGVSGALMGLVTFRKIEWVWLNSALGIHSLNIAKSGPDATFFDAFVERLLAQVIEANKSVDEELK